MSGTLNEQLQQIANTKDAIAQAINDKGVSVTSDDSFATYATKIGEIQGSGSGETIIVQGGSSFNLFDTKLVDHILEGDEAKGWALQGSAVTKNDYPEFYERCLKEFNSSTLLDNIYTNDNGHKFYDISYKSTIDAEFEQTGMAWMYGIDQENEQIILPRNNFFEQASVANVGETVEAGLPNIEGNIYSTRVDDSLGPATGAFKNSKHGTANVGFTNGTSGVWDDMVFDASQSNVIYGNSDTVQPNAVKKLLYICVGDTSQEVKPSSVGGNSSFDIKYSDRILNDNESIGWGLAGSKVYKADYPDFYNKCVEEYNGGIAIREPISYNVEIHGEVEMPERGVITNFSSDNYCITDFTIPSKITSFDFGCKVTLPEYYTGLGTIYGQQTNNYYCPQLGPYTNGAVYAWIASATSSWDLMTSVTCCPENYYGKTVWIRVTWDGSEYATWYSDNGVDWNKHNTLQSTKAPYWREAFKIGCDQSSGSNIGAPDMLIDLKDCYVVLNNEEVWRGASTLDMVEANSSHKYYNEQIDEAISAVNYIYDNEKSANFYGINTNEEYIKLPRPKKIGDTYSYYCVGNTEVGETIIDVSREIELNNPFFLGMSEYFEKQPNNLSWLKSDGSYHTKEMYPSMYEYIKENIEKGTNDFKLITEEYDDYCYVLDEDNNKFRLPLLNGSEDLPSDNSFDIPLTKSYDTYTAPANGFITSNGFTTAASGSLGFYNSSLELIIGRGSNDGNVRVFLPVSKGQTVTFYAYYITVTSSRFVYAKGNGSLYYYVGEAVNNATLVDLGKITTEIATKVSRESDAFDGEWVHTDKFLLADGVGCPTSQHIYSIHDYLPQDGYDYEVCVNASVTTEATSGKESRVFIGSDVTKHVTGLCMVITRSAAYRFACGNCILHVGTGRQIKVASYANNTGKYFLSLCGYRRLGRKENK